MKEETLYNLALSIAHGVGPVQSARIIGQINETKEFFEMTVEERLAHFEDVRKPILTQDYGDTLLKAKSEIEWCKEKKIKIHTFLDKEYPRRLHHIPDKPLSLYVKGECDLSSLRTVAIVGTRKATEYGKIFTDKLVRALKAYDVHIVSGMASGIDSAAHQACLKYGVPTIGVLAHGLNMIYPPKNRNLAKHILQQAGALITEFPSGTTPEREHFPMRNRIIAGMSDVVIVIESEQKGGSMITADLANNYNKDVFALPGRHDDKYSSGCNMLIKSQRAHLLESVEDIEYIMRWSKRETEVNIQTSLFNNLPEDQKELLHLLKHKKELHVDEIASEMQLAQGKISELLLMLELNGMVKCLPGNVYVAL